MDLHYVGVLLGTGGAYAKTLLDMGGVSDPPSLTWQESYLFIYLFWVLFGLLCFNVLG
jgi:hypothetical protein